MSVPHDLTNGSKPKGPLEYDMESFSSVQEVHEETSNCERNIKDQQTNVLQWKINGPVSSHEVLRVLPIVSLLSTCSSHCSFMLGLDVCKLPFQGSADS